MKITVLILEDESEEAVMAALKNVLKDGFVKLLPTKTPGKVLPREEPRRYSETEKHVLETIAGMQDAAMGREKLVGLCAETMPKPEDGRDTGMVWVSVAITNLCKGKDAPLREINGIVHFLMV